MAVVVYDACVLHPPELRDLLMRLAHRELVQARWTERILDETFESIRRRRPDLDEERLQRTRRLMCEAIPDCVVVGHDGLAEHVALPDPDDRHVVAAAIKCSARVIVTANLRDFPAGTLAPLNIEAVHPDDVALDLLAVAPAQVVNVLHEQAAALKKPPMALPDVLRRLEDSGLVLSMAEVRRLMEVGG